MIKATNQQILDSIFATQILMACKLPIKAAYAVSKLGKACAIEERDINEMKQKIFTEGGCTIIDGRWSGADEEKFAAAIKEVEAMLSIEIEINAIPLDIEQFGNAEIPGNAFYGLDWAMKPE